MDEITKPVLSDDEHHKNISKNRVLQLICVIALFVCHGFLLATALCDFVLEYNNLRTHIFMSEFQSDGTCPSKFLSFSCCLSQPQSSIFPSSQYSDETRSLKESSLWMTRVSVSQVGVVSGISDDFPCQLPMIVTPIDFLSRFRLKIDLQCPDAGCESNPCPNMLSPFALDFVSEDRDQTFSIQDDTITAKYQPVKVKNEISFDLSVASILSAVAVNLRSLLVTDLIEDVEDTEREWLMSAMLSMGFIDRNTAFSVFSFYDGRYPSMQNIYCFTEKENNDDFSGRGSCFVRLGNLLAYPTVGTEMEYHSPFLLSECVLSLLDTLSTNEDPACELNALNLGFIFFPSNNVDDGTNAFFVERESTATDYYDEPEYFADAYYYFDYFYNDESLNTREHVSDYDNGSSVYGGDSANMQRQDEEELSNDLYYYQNYLDDYFWDDDSLRDQGILDPFHIHSNVYENRPVRNMDYTTNKDKDYFQSSFMYDDHGGARYSGNFIRYMIDNGRIFDFSKRMMERNEEDDTSFNFRWQSLPWIFAKAILEQGSEYDEEWVDDVVTNMMFQDMFAQLCPINVMNPSPKHIDDTIRAGDCAMLTMTLNVKPHSTAADTNNENEFDYQQLRTYGGLSDYQRNLNSNELFLCQVSVWEAFKQAWATSVSVETYLLLCGLLGNFLVSVALIWQLWDKRNRKETTSPAPQSKEQIVSAIAIIV